MVTGGIILLGTLVLLNLLLTFGVIRRLREHSTALATLTPPTDDGEPRWIGDIPVVGAKVGEFVATTEDGELVSADRLARNTVVVFVAPTCQDCRAQLPDLIDWAGRQARERVLVVIDGTMTDPAEFVPPVNRVARVIVERSGTPVMAAFGVTAFPASCVVVDGTVVAAGAEFTRLPVPL